MSGARCRGESDRSEASCPAGVFVASFITAIPLFYSSYLWSRNAGARERRNAGGEVSSRLLGRRSKVPISAESPKKELGLPLAASGDRGVRIPRRDIVARRRVQRASLYIYSILFFLLME